MNCGPWFAGVRTTGRRCNSRTAVAATGIMAAAAAEGAGEASTTGRPGCPRPRASRRRRCRPGRRRPGRTRIAPARGPAGGGVATGRGRATAGAGVVVTRVKLSVVSVISKGGRFCLFGAKGNTSPFCSIASVLQAASCLWSAAQAHAAQGPCRSNFARNTRPPAPFRPVPATQRIRRDR